MEFSHTLGAGTDALFLLYGPRESGWLQRLEPGSEIVCCNGCRKVFYAGDWEGACPVCGGESLVFRCANQLLLREREEQDGVTVWRPLRAQWIQQRPPEPPRPNESAEPRARLGEQLKTLEAERDQLEDRILEAREDEQTAPRQSARTASAAFTALSAAFIAVRLLSFFL